MLAPPATGWLSLRPEYAGQGIAIFSDPVGELKGSVSIAFTEHGDPSVTMEAAQIEAPSPYRGSLLAFLHGTPHPHGHGMSFGTRQNPCTSLVVTTPIGTYRATGRLHYSVTAPLFVESAVGLLTFSPATSTFEMADRRAPRYWVLPLLNFLSDFVDLPDDELKAHPLRLYRSTSPTAGLSPEGIRLAAQEVALNDRLIVFNFADGRAFIERLPDYHEREARLVSGSDRTLVTAVIVGPMGTHPCDLDSLDGWFPFHFLNFLGLATGTSVGAPWLEFRDDRGTLVRRLHIYSTVPSFSKGHATIRESIHHGLGALLEAAARLRPSENDGLIVATQNLIKWGLPFLTVEDKLDYLFRALDGLCTFYKIKGTDSASILGERHKAVKSILQQTNREIMKVAKEANDAGDRDAASLLETIANIVTGAGSPQLSFGKAVLRLLKHFDLPDGDILARYYSDYPRSDGKDWPALLSYYRGLTVHRNYFDVRAGFDIYDAVTLMFHLQDVLTRLVLKAIDYSGVYQPSVIKMLIDCRPDWVTEATSAKALGYAENPRCNCSPKLTSTP